MTFTELQAQVCDRLKIKSSDTESRTRVGALINQVHREVTAGLGMSSSRRTTVSLAATIGSQLITVTGCEKIERIRDTTRNPPTLDEITYMEMRDVVAPASDTVTRWAEESRTDDTVTIRCDVAFLTTKALYADVWTTASTLSGSQEPIFPASYHDILVHGVLVQEYMRSEKPALADREEKKYERRMSQLRHWLAIAGNKVLRQGQVEPGVSGSSSAGASAGSSVFSPGVWTPTIGGSGGQSGQVYSIQSGQYEKFGTFVRVQCRVALSTLGTITGAVQIGGLPFTIANTTYGQPVGAMWWSALTSSFVQLVGVGVVNTTTVSLYGATAAATGLSTLAQANLSATTDVILTLCYRATE